MKLYLSRFLLPAAVALNLFGTPAGMRAATPKASTTACSLGRSAAPAGDWRWPAGANVSVYTLRGAFNSTDLGALKAAVTFWNSAVCGSGVRLVFGGETDGFDASPGSVTITRVQTFENKRHLAEISVFFEHGSAELIRWAVVRIDPRVTGREQLRSVFAHELAHTLGLGDCPTCARGTTIMSDYRGLNAGNGLDYPSDCDVESVRGGYLTAGGASAAGARGGER